MSFPKFQSFLSDEAGATIVEWTTLGAAVVGFSIASVAAVQSGLINLGGNSGDSLQVSAVAYTDNVASGGPDVQMNTNGKNVYTPLSTRKDEYAAFLYELAGKSEAELRSIYVSYLEEAEKLLAAGDKEGAAKYLDVAGAAASVMKDYRYALPDTETKLNQYYGQLKTNDQMVSDDKTDQGKPVKTK
jgi:Flp pilus assembly pilin Flp